MDCKNVFVITEDVIEECLSECLSDSTSNKQFQPVYAELMDSSEKRM